MASVDVGSPSSASREAVDSSAPNFWSILDGFDNFLLGQDSWIVRPEARKLKRVLEDLSPGLDGWPSQSLNELAGELMKCLHQEQAMVGVCQKIRGLLESVFESLADELTACRNGGEPMVGVGLEMRRLFKFMFEGQCNPCGIEEELPMVGLYWHMQLVAIMVVGMKEAQALSSKLGMKEAQALSSKLDSFRDGVSLELAKAMHRSWAVFRVGWAFTWVETLLLEHDMLRIRGSHWMQTIKDMQPIKDRWNKLHFCWPPGLKRTKEALDFHRRSALLACGEEGEAVQNFEAPDFYKGFEACFLCHRTSNMYNYGFRSPGRLSYGYGWSVLRDKVVCWLERAADASPQHHEYWPLVRLSVLVEYTAYGSVLLGNALAECQQKVDLQLRFDFPVPLPEIQFLKLTTLIHLDQHRETGWQPQELVPEIGWPEVLDRLGIVPEVLDRLDIVQSFYQARYAYACLVLRGQQLIAHFGKLEEGLEAFHTCLARLEAFHKCLAKSRSSHVLSEMGWHVLSEMGWFGKWIFEFCAITMECYIEKDIDHPERANRIQAFLVAHDYNLDAFRRYKLVCGNALAVCRAWSSYDADVTRFGQQGLQLQLHADSKGVVEAFWRVYKDCCAALSEASLRQCRYEVRQMAGIRGQTLQAFAGSWIPSFYLFRVHVVAATVSADTAFPHNPVRPRADEIARQALLSVETARNYKDEGFGPHINWERIKRGHTACGPGAVFVQFAGLGLKAPEYGRSLEEWPSERDGLPMCVLIVVQDDGVASCHELIASWPGNIRKNVQEIADACSERDLERESCRKAMETLYDVLIRPLFDKYIHKGKEWNRHRKLVISAVGFCKDVPFSILRNRDSGRYLFEEAQLAFTPSFLLLDHCHLRYESLQKRSLLAGAGAAVVVGDPYYMYRPPLPGSGEEVDAISKLFDFCKSKHEIEKVTGKCATKEKVLELVKKASTGVATSSGRGQCSQAFIHVAAHGSGGKETDLGSVILATERRTPLAAQAGGNVTRDDEKRYGEPQEAADSSDDMHAAFFGDQVLELEQLEACESDTATEGLEFLPWLLRSLRKSNAGTSKLLCDDILLSGVEWSAHMVVLSACDTARGVARDSNVLDVLSFSRAFMTAGVPCSVLSQWGVDDEATVQLMPLFYEALRQGEEACSALQSAMIKMRESEKKYTLHQIAPFVVTGLPTVRLPTQMQMRPCPVSESEFTVGSSESPTDSVSLQSLMAGTGAPIDVVSSTDEAWERRLPANWNTDLQPILGGAHPTLQYSTKEELFERLCAGLLLDDGRAAYWIDAATSGVCRAVSASSFNITWGWNPSYWIWPPTSTPEAPDSPEAPDPGLPVNLGGSRFNLVAYLKEVCWFEVSSKIRVSLPPGTYTLSLRIAFSKNWFGWNRHKVTLRLKDGHDLDIQSQGYLCRPHEHDGADCLVKLRQADSRWLEWDLGQFTVLPGQAVVELDAALSETASNEWKGGLVFDGAVIRPSHLIHSESE